MEITGVVSGAAEEGRVRVTVFDEDSEEETEVLAANLAGAVAGDRVKLFVPDATDELVMGVVYFLPLGGAIGGALAGAGLGRVSWFTETVRSLGGRFLGPILAGGHNLAMAGAGVGLAAALAVAVLWIKGRKSRAMARAEILEVLKS